HQPRAGLAEDPAVRGHHPVATVVDRFHDRFDAGAVHAVVVGEVGRAEVGVAGAVDAVAGDADAIVQALALDGEVVVLRDPALRERTHVGRHREHGVVAAHAGEHRTPGRHHPFATVEHGFEHAFGGAAPVPDVVGEIGITDRALRRRAVAGGAGVGEERAAQARGGRVAGQFVEGAAGVWAGGPG